MRVSVEKVSWRVDERDILNRMTLEIATGSFVGIVGPNGSGKSSLLRCIYRILKPDAGVVRLDENDVWQMSAREAAQGTAVVLQEMPSEFEFTVHEIVSMGRTPHKGIFDKETDDDLRFVDEALKKVGMSELVGRSFHTLSGGEKQRVIVARALAQQTRFLVLDEPTNHLDIRYQLEILELVRGIGVTTIAAVHDLNLAAAFCDYIYVVNHGEIVASGPPEQLLQPDLISEVFGVGSMVDTHPFTGKPRITFHTGKAAHTANSRQNFNGRHK